MCRAAAELAHATCKPWALFFRRVQTPLCDTVLTSGITVNQFARAVAGHLVQYWGLRSCGLSFSIKTPTVPRPQPRRDTVIGAPTETLLHLIEGILQAAGGRTGFSPAWAQLWPTIIRSSTKHRIFQTAPRAHPASTLQAAPTYPGSRTSHPRRVHPPHDQAPRAAPATRPLSSGAMRRAPYTKATGMMMQTASRDDAEVDWA
jgi:hypothetical protein